MCGADHSINFSFTHLKFVKNITQFDLYFSCILWRLQNLKSEASFERITIKTIRHIFRNISDRFYYFASSFIIFSTSEISISSISAICSIENCSIIRTMFHILQKFYQFWWHQLKTSFNKLKSTTPGGNNLLSMIPWYSRLLFGRLCVFSFWASTSYITSSSSTA